MSKKKFKKKAAKKKEQEITIEELSAQKTEIAVQLINDSLKTNSKATQLEKALLDVSTIGFPKVENFVNLFIEKYPDPMFQKQIFDIVLRKIELASPTVELTNLKSEVLFGKAKTIITINLTEERTQIKLENAKEALKILESAHAMQNNDLTTSIKNTIKTLITTHPDPQEAFQLAQSSAEFREQNLGNNHPSILEAHIIAAQVGHTSEVKAIKIKAMQSAELSYNMALELKNDTDAATSLKLLAIMHKSFGDIQKTDYLLAQAAFLEEVAVKKVVDSKEKEALPTKPSNTYEIIRKYGINDELTITIKQKIQKSILNPVYEAAKQGNWVHKVASIEYGVSGYLGNFLTKELGNNQSTTENINIALMLCFEAINLGIMNNPTRNPLCGAAFAQQYPDLLSNILYKHPEYFVDGHILKATVLKAGNHAQNLLGKEALINGSYNTYLETIMMPIIADRLSTSVLKPISALIKANKWDSSTERQLLAYANEEYLTGKGTIYTSTLGQNLSTLSDSVNISRILIFKEVLEAIKLSGSKNYAPVEIFAKAYNSVIKRILEDHSDYITNKHIIEICQQTLPNLESTTPLVVDSAQVKFDVPVIGENQVSEESVDS